MVIAEFLGTVVVVLLLCMLISFVLEKFFFQSREAYWLSAILIGVVTSVGKLKGLAYKMALSAFGDTEQGRVAASNASSYLNMNAEISRFTLSIELIVPYVFCGITSLSIYFLYDNVSKNKFYKKYFEALILYTLTTVLVWGISSLFGVLIAGVIGIIFTVASLLYFRKNKVNENKINNTKKSNLNTIKNIATQDIENGVKSELSISSQKTAIQLSKNNSQIESSKIAGDQAITKHGQTNSASDDLWAQALAEYDSGSRKQGLWARLFSEAQGNEALVKANYLRTRVDEMQFAIEQEDERVEAVKRAEIVKKQVLVDAMTDEQRTYDALPKGVCPSCQSAVLILNASFCSKCLAYFGKKARLSGSRFNIIEASKQEQINALQLAAQAGKPLTEYEAELLKRGQ